MPANHLHYYAGSGDNRQLILDLPHDALSLTGHHHELARLFDAPRFFALDEPLKRYLDFLLEEVSLLASAGGLSILQQERLASTLLGSLHARLASEPNARGRTLDLAALERYIDRHLGGPLRVSDLASEACLSEAHFTQRFRAQTGMSPWQYVIQRRLSAAHRLLLESDLPLSEIAALSGFANQSALSHAFRRAHGHPPSRLRKNADTPPRLLENRSCPEAD
ncbi:MAG TPA: AraC family transcriptional regulator [Halomonas sp.]|nr:AraC family transcriptional regulator [Halomonas sp.]